MLEELLIYDSKGILPFAYEGKDDFSKRSRQYLHAFEDYNPESIINKVRYYFDYDISGKIEEGKLLHLAARINKVYGFDLSVIKGYYMFVGPGLESSIYPDFQGTMLYCFSPLQGYKIPPTIIVNQCKLVKREEKKVILHELMHIPRVVLKLKNRQSDGFEEVFYNSLAARKDKRKLRQIRRKLKGHFGINAGYILGRIGADEIDVLLRKETDPVEFIKFSAKYFLRFGIMAERLGL